MDVRSALKSQYHAALKTLQKVIEKWPEEMWNDPADGAARFWRVAYHTLFVSHFYLQQDQAGFTPWSRHRDEAQFISTSRESPARVRSSRKASTSWGATVGPMERMSCS